MNTEQLTPGTTPEMPFDGRQVVPFRKLEPSALPALNRDLGTRLDEARLAWLKQHYTKAEQRDPTVGELRLFDSLDQLTRHTAARLAAGALYTDSGALADAWSDMMARRHALSPENSTPCTLSELLPLTGRWLSRAGDGRFMPAPTRRVLAEADDRPAEGVALAAGIQPAFRLLSVVPGEDGLVSGTLCAGDASLRHSRLICTMPASGNQPVPGYRPVPGDTLVRLRRADTKKLRRLLASPLSPEAVGAVPSGVAPSGAAPLSAVCRVGCAAGQPLPLAILSLVPGATVELSKLLPPEARADRPIQSLCALGTAPAQAGQADYILCVRAADAPATLALCQRMELEATAIGRVTEAGHFAVTLEGKSLVRVGTALVRTAVCPCLYTFHLPVPEETEAPTVRLPWLFMAASPYAGASCLTEDGRETVAREADPGCLLLPARALYAAAAETDRPDYVRARDTLLAAVAQLAARGVARQDMALSVSLRYTIPADSTGYCSLLSALCGLYRAAVELCLPMPDPILSAIPSGAEEADSLSVLAFRVSSQPLTVVPPCPLTPGHRLYLLFSEADRLPAAQGGPDFAEWRVMTDRIASRPAGLVGLSPLVNQGRTLSDLLASAPGVSLSPVGQMLAHRPFRMAFLAEVDPETAGASFPGVPVGTVAPSCTQSDTQLEAETVPVQAAVSPAPKAADSSWIAQSAPAGPAPASDTRPLAVLPVLRRGEEAAVEAVASVLTTRGYRCMIYPVATDSVMGETVFDEKGVVLRPAAPMRRLVPAATQKLMQQLERAALVVLAISEADATLLAEDKAIAGVLDRLTGRGQSPAALSHATPRLLSVGLSCLTLSRAGYLPESLSAGRLVHVPAAGRLIPVSDSADCPVMSTRLCQRDLLCLLPAQDAAGEPDTLLTLHTPGRDVPDGYVGCGGRVLGYLNGLPDRGSALYGRI